MKLSIAMTTYNGEKYIEKQLTTILNQSRQADEVIISDDHSTDDTARLVKNFIEYHQLEHWSFQRNQGAKGFIGNFFNAIKQTSGDIIFLCDQDDEWAENKLECMEQTMLKNTEIKALNTAVRLIDEKGSPLHLRQKRGYCNENILHQTVSEDELRQFPFAFLVKTNISPGCTMCFTRQLKEEFLKYETQCVQAKFPHDWFLNLLASVDNGTYFLNSNFTYYRMHENNTIGVNREEEEKTTEIKSTIQSRQEIGKFHYERASFILEEIPLNTAYKSYIEKYLKFTRERYRFLQTLSLKRLVYVYKYFNLYYHSIGVKGMISDIIYGLRLDGKFRK